MLRGSVVEFDEAEGLGTVEDDSGTRYLFHIVEIADRSRTIGIGQMVAFEILPRFGMYQAGRLLKV
jgi:cold shock CspA family protein